MTYTNNFSIQSQPYLLFTVLILICFLSSLKVAKAATFTVINTDDSGTGSLRQAIIDANATSGTDTVAFSISSGVQTINPITQFPDITDPIVINGSTQPGFVGQPLIVIDGTLVTGSGNISCLRITGGSSIIRGIVINNYQSGQAVQLGTNGGNTIQGCYFGIAADGTTRRRNFQGLFISSSNNLIGGTTLLERNVISGNTFENVLISGGGSNNSIQGNFIGTNASGTESGNGGFFGVTIQGAGTGNIVGGTIPGALNLISGNPNGGVDVYSAGTLIQGNLIGTDLTGRLPIPNSGIGIRSSGSGVLIGGITAPARNIIFGGVGISFTDTMPLTRIQGNYIGVDITGRNVFLNMSRGITTSGPVIIGGTEPGSGNVISGNSGGITLSSFDNVGSIVQGNLIGTDSTGTIALGNGGGIGLDIRSSNNLIGGTVSGAGNVISGNNGAIDIGSSTTAQLTGNRIQGNFIGTDITGNLPLPNRGFSTITSVGSNTLIGGSVPGAGNLIAYNSGSGVRLASFIGPTIGNTIQRNSFFMNGGLAVDLVGANGVNTNDTCDVDIGPNNLQNYPVLAAAISNGTTTNITGSLNSIPNATFTVDFYISPTYDTTNFGEGKTYIGSTNVTTANDCNGSFNLPIIYPSAGSQFITATATDSNGNTSEYSRYIQASGSSTRSIFDFDGDGKTDISIFRPSVGEWYYQRSSNSVVNGAQFGNSTNKVVPADYTGDGKTDIAFFRPSTGEWFVLRSEDSSFYAFPFGADGDIPTLGDFDGDGKGDVAVFRPSTGIWYVNKSSGGVTITPFGTNGDRPVSADYDGDGKSDIAIFRPSVGEWYYLRSVDSQVRGNQFGSSTDKTVQGDYTGDGKADFAFFRPSNGNWYVLRSEDSSFFASPFGASTDTPTIGDYDGDGKFDQAVFRPSNSVWYVNRSTAGIQIQQFGVGTDLPVPSYYLP
jgi:hypothetical protein